MVNGHHHPSADPPDGHLGILLSIATQVGELRSDVRNLTGRLDRMEGRPSVPRRPLSDWLTLIGGACLVAAAAAGKITWDQALPSLLGIAGR